jgi:predicted TIM-barrel fold metal-dependent hydrolase
MPAAPRWLDLHVHASDWGEDGRYRPNLAEDLVAVLDAADADLRLILSPDRAWYDAIGRDPDAAMRGNEMIHDLVERAPGRLYGACLVNPRFPDASMRVMERCFERWGFVLLGEMLPYFFDFRMDSDAVGRLVRKAADYGAPVQVHISTSNARTHPSGFGREQMLDLFGIVERAPEARYILAHAVGGRKADPPVVDEYLDMIEARFGAWPRNFWMEIADFSSPGVASALRRVPQDRLVVGTDWTTRVGPPFLPYGAVFGVTSAAENPFPPCVGTLVEFLAAAGADEAAIQAIGFANAAALLRLAP